MLSLIPLLTFALCVGYAFSLMHLVAAASAAPLGYEDEDGFHFGLDPEYVRKQFGPHQGLSGTALRFDAGKDLTDRRQIYRETSRLMEGMKLVFAVLAFVCFAVFYGISLLTPRRMERARVRSAC